MDTNKLKAILVAILVTFIALWLGMNAATAQVETILWVVGSSVMIFCALLGTRIWMVIPFGIALSLTVKIPGQPSTDILAKLLFIGFCVLLFLIRKLPYRFYFRELEAWSFLLLACVLQVYLRNPVGLSLFGSDSVGAKPYAFLAINMMTAIILFGLTVPARELKWMMRLSYLGWILNFVLFSIGTLIPTIGVYYGAANPYNRLESQNPDINRATRISFLGTAGESAARCVASYLSPLRTLVKPKWAILLLFSLICAGMSGFRNDVAMVGLIYIFALIYHGGFNHLAIATLMLIATLTVLAIVNLMMPLPNNIQRSLSFFPGTWNESIKRDAQESSEWRFEIWKDVMFTDEWISNKWVGDGLGFTKRELQRQLDIMEMELNSGHSMQGISGFDLHRESILANGDYHSGPIQTIRTIGYLGLTVMLLAMIRLAVHAHRLIKRYKGTEWQPLTLFVGIPLIVAPFFFTFIFGTFQLASTTFLIGAGMLRLVQNSLPAPSRPIQPETQPAKP